MDKPFTRSYTFGRFCLDVDTERLWKGKARVELTPTEYKVLLYLIEHRDRAVSVERLMQDVWETTVEGNSVNQIVSTLREKLRGSVREQKNKYIKTEARKGYCFMADVVVVEGCDNRPESTPPPVVNQPSEATYTGLETQAHVAEVVAGTTGTPASGDSAASSQSEEHSPPPDPSQSPEYTFSLWVFHSGLKVTAALAVGVGLVVAFSASALLGANERLAALCFLKFFVITCALLLNPRARGSEVFQHADPAIEAEIMEECGYGGHPEEWEEAKVQAN